MEIVVVRHGETKWNRENIFTGWTDIDLSDKGEQEAIHSGELLKETGYDFDKVYTSVLKRSIHTANIIMDVMDRDWLEITKDYRLNERHYGALQGLNKEEAAHQLGIDNVYQWRRTYEGRPPLLSPLDQRAPSFQETYRNIESSMLPLAESIKDTQMRVARIWHEDIKKDMLDGKRILMVMHANSTRAFIQEIIPQEVTEIEDLFIPTGNPLVFTFDALGNALSWTILGNPESINQKIETMKSRVIKVI